MAETVESATKTSSARHGRNEPAAADADFPFDNAQRIRENPASEGESH
jgi:hypothetical protein